MLANKAIRLEELDGTVEVIGRRFCSNRSLTELLAASARAHPPYEERLRAMQAVVLELAENAMSLSLGGNQAGAVRNLLQYGKETLNARLIDNAWQLLQKHAAKISDAQALNDALNALRGQYGTAAMRASLGEQKRQAGGLALRTGTRPAPEKIPKTLT